MILLGSPVSIEITGNVVVESSDAAALHLYAEGTVIRVVAPSVRDALVFSKQAAITRGGGRHTLRRVTRLCATTGMLLKIQVGRYVVVQIGSGFHAGPLMHWLGLSGVKLHPLKILKALLERRCD